MIRSSILAGMSLSLLLAAGCDKAADDQDKATNAQAEANVKVEAAQAAADTKIKSAQADADKKIAEARASFQKLREDFRHTTTNDLIALDKKIADLEISATTKAGSARSDLEGALTAIRAGRARITIDFEAVDAAEASIWDEAKESLELELADLRGLVDRA
jgi:hypothetical protein